MKVCTDSCVFGAWLASKANTNKRILDIGSGTGLLMLMLAQESGASIDGIEIEPGCFRQLQSNLELSPWRDRLRALKADVREYQFTEKYDLIVCNPPFYSSDLLSKSNTNQIARHSIELSLAELFNIVPGILTPQGQFAVLLPYHRLEEAKKIGQHVGLKIYEQLDLYQTSGHEVFRVMIYFSGEQHEAAKFSKLVIKNKAAYTADFVDLLKPFYLAF